MIAINKTIDEYNNGFLKTDLGACSEPANMGFQVTVGCGLARQLNFLLDL